MSPAIPCPASRESIEERDWDQGCPLCGKPADEHPNEDLLPVTPSPATPVEQPAVDDVTFMENVREAIENGFDLVCSRCGVGVYDESDIHERRCPEFKEPA